ncbi:MAG: redoxin domain-containing protein, partial [Pedobacter sp.]
MKKNILNIVIALLWLIFQKFLRSISFSLMLVLFLTTNYASAQESLSTGIAVGQKIPEILRKAKMVSISPFREEIISLADFKGKAIIIDFWASWCLPCLRNMPVLDSLYRDKKADLQVIMMNASSSRDGYLKERKFIRGYLKQRPAFISTIVLRNNLFRQYFRFTIVPHYVWIGADGIVKAITEHT